MSADMGLGRRAGMLTVIGLGCAGAVIGLVKLLSGDLAEAAEDYPDDAW